MKKVLIFSLAYYPYVGGAEVALKEITDRIDPRDIEFHLLTLRFNSALSKEGRIGNVIVHRIGKGTANPSMADLQKYPLKFYKYWYQFAAAAAAARLHAELHFDGMWAMMAHSAGIPAALFKTFHPEVKYLLTLQEGDPLPHIERLARPVWPFFKRAFTKADALQAISTFLAHWGTRMGFPGTPVIIPNGADITHFATASSKTAELKKEYGKKEGDIWLVSTSRLVHKNALDDVIRAFVYLPASVSFVNFGFGPDEEKLKALAEKHGVADRTHLLPHPGVPALPAYLSVGDIFIRPSRSEGMGVSFIEAMAAGLPIIATQEGGIPDFLFDAKRNPGKPTTGWAVDKDSPEQIAEAVKEIIAHPEEVKMVTENARKLATQKYDWNLIAKQMKDLFDRVLQSR